MQAIEYGNADLLLKIRPDESLSRQIGSRVVLSGLPQHLRQGGRVWLTAGSGQETVGRFDLSAAATRGRGRLSFPGATDPWKSNAGLLPVKKGSLREERLPVRLERGAGRPRHVGSFVYVRPDAGALVVLRNPEVEPRAGQNATTRLLGSGIRRPLSWEEVPSRESIRSTSERTLSERYSAFLGGGRRWGQWLFFIDSRTAIVNDLWDGSLEALIEVKGNSDRAAIRMAVGSLLDQRHALKVHRASSGSAQQSGVDPLLVVLVPNRPDASTLSWLESLRIGCVWRIRGGFEDNADGLFLQSEPVRRLKRKALKWCGP